MKISLNWISDFVDIKGIDVRKLAFDVTEKVAEVEHVESSPANQPTIVVGLIREVRPHPNADKLRVCIVDVGLPEPVQIVCGGENVRADLRVAVALPGARVRWHGEGDPVAIEATKLRGEPSYGMICSAAEIEVAPEVLGHEPEGRGVVELATDVPGGTPLAVAYPALSDTIFEIDNHSITHRPDLFGHLGAAREIALVVGREFKKPDIASDLQTLVDRYGRMGGGVGDVRLWIDDTQLCPRYVGVRISGITVQPSPTQIVERLAAAGVRAINNVVDASNYVMMELGQPTHAFDAKKVSGKITVRKATAGEVIATLDGETRNLTDSMLVIADEAKAIAIAGVMGGANSEVDETTTEIILESANFDAVSVRRTSTALGLRSEASLRYEKRLDPHLTALAAVRFVEVLRQTCPGATVEFIADCDNADRTPQTIEVSHARIATKLGVEIADDEVVRILTALECSVEKNGDTFRVTVPTWRGGRDIEMADDIIEEVARHFGYNRIATAFPSVALTSPARDTLRDLTRELSDTLLGFGFNETCTLGLTKLATIEAAGFDSSAVRTLVNPPSEDFRAIRSDVLPSLLDAAARNSRATSAFRLFEIGTAFVVTADGANEHPQLVALIVGEDDVFARAKGVVTRLLGSMKYAVALMPTTEDVPARHPGRTAAVMVEETCVGYVSELHPAIAGNFDLPTTGVIELAVDALATITRDVVLAKPLPRYPGVPRDLAIIVPLKTLARDIEAAIASADARVVDVRLFDEYIGDKVAAGTKSLAFSFEIRDSEKTLAESEVDAVWQKILASVVTIGGTVRT